MKLNLERYFCAFSDFLVFFLSLFVRYFFNFYNISYIFSCFFRNWRNILSPSPEF